MRVASSTPPRPMLGGVEISVGVIPTPETEALRLSTTVAFVHTATATTRPAGVAWIHTHHRHASALGCGTDKLSQLVAAPGMVRVARCLRTVIRLRMCGKSFRDNTACVSLACATTRCEIVWWTARRNQETFRAIFSRRRLALVVPVTWEVCLARPQRGHHGRAPAPSCRGARPRPSSWRRCPDRHPEGVWEPSAVLPGVARVTRPTPVLSPNTSAAGPVARRHDPRGAASVCLGTGGRSCRVRSLPAARLGPARRRVPRHGLGEGCPGVHGRIGTQPVPACGRQPGGGWRQQGRWRRGQGQVSGIVASAPQVRAPDAWAPAPPAWVL